MYELLYIKHYGILKLYGRVKLTICSNRWEIWENFGCCWGHKERLCGISEIPLTALLWQINSLCYSLSSVQDTHQSQPFSHISKILLCYSGRGKECIIVCQFNTVENHLKTSVSDSGNLKIVAQLFYFRANNWTLYVWLTSTVVVNCKQMNKTENKTTIQTNR